MGWKRSAANSNDQITFFQLGGIILGLYGRRPLGEDICLACSEGHSFSSLTLAHNPRSKEKVSAKLTEAEAASATIAKPAEASVSPNYMSTE